MRAILILILGAAMANEPMERRLPFAPDAERAVLGGILVNNLMLDEAGILKPEDFFLDNHRKLFSVLQEMRENSKVIDSLTLIEELQRKGILSGAGGAAWVSGLLDGIPYVANVGHYAAIVKEKAILRNVIHACHAIQNSAFEEGEEAAKLLDSAVVSFMDMALDASAGKMGTITERDAGAMLLSAFSKPTSVRIFTGIQDLDDEICGFISSDYVTLVASTGAGKTLFARQIRRRACQDNFHMLYVTGEMSAAHLKSRELSTMAKVPTWKMRRYEKITQDEMTAMARVAGDECDQCEILDGNLSLQKIRIAARAMKKKLGERFGGIINDYDELIEAPGKDDLEKQTNLVRGMHALKNELGVPVIMVSQLNKPQEKTPKARKKGDTAKPVPITLHRIFGVGAKIKFSSLVLYVHREYLETLDKAIEAQAEIYILKSRDGRLGRIAAAFSVPTLRFEDAPPTEAESVPDTKARQAKDDSQGNLL